MSFDLKLSKGSFEIRDGALQIVQGKDKLLQDILKMLFTQTGENPTHKWYGTPLLTKAIGQAGNLDLLISEITESVNYGLSNIKVLQEMQERDNQFVSPQELLAKILNIKVESDEVDPRKLVVNILVSAKSKDLVNESFTIRI